MEKTTEEIKSFITEGKAVLGIEFGSTRIKGVLTDEDHKILAVGIHDWENAYVDGLWTYSEEAIMNGLKSCYGSLRDDVASKYGIKLEKIAAMGFSGMMHGYIPLDENGRILAPFRTWRNTNTAQAAEKLSDLFDFNIPMRWSISHLYQAVLNKEEHVKDIRFLTTLAGYIHLKLTGEKVLGVGEASGMFPIDSATLDYDENMLSKFEGLDDIKQFDWNIREILPKVLPAGEKAGVLTEDGAKLLDDTGALQAGTVLAPPEGDAGTGMTATNSVGVRTGNVSAGTSVFAMVVMEKPLKKRHDEIDLVTTPSGEAVAMVHCNNCTSDINAWVGLFREFAKLSGHEMPDNDIYSTLYKNAMTGAENCGGVINFNTVSGEPVIGLSEGRPMIVRKPDADMSLANFIRSCLYGSLAALKIGCDILFKEEDVKVDTLYAHGGLFKTEGVGQNILAAAMNAPVSVMQNAGEGGPWGMAILASYMIYKKDGETLADYLNSKVFTGNAVSTVAPDAASVKGFDEYIESFKALNPVEKTASEVF